MAIITSEDVEGSNSSFFLIIIDRCFPINVTKYNLGRFALSIIVTYHPVVTLELMVLWKLWITIAIFDLMVDITVFLSLRDKRFIFHYLWYLVTSLRWCTQIWISKRSEDNITLLKSSKSLWWVETPKVLKLI